MDNIASLYEEITQLHADVCSALADPKRILLIYTLAEKPRNVGELAQALSMNQPTVSRHLKLLRERGLVHAERQGACVEYQLTDTRLVQALDLLRAVLNDRLNYRAKLAQADQTSRE